MGCLADAIKITAQGLGKPPDRRSAQPRLAPKTGRIDVVAGESTAPAIPLPWLIFPFAENRAIP
jgi:hypothetical protein